MRINVEEYVSEVLACWDPEEGKLSAKDLAGSIADIAMAQGYYEGREFADVIAELVPQVEYYL